MTDIDERSVAAATISAGQSNAVTTPSRRSLLMGGLGALAGLAASALGRPQEANATNGGAILLGNEPGFPFDGTGTNQASATTKVYTTVGTGFWAEGPSGGLVGLSSGGWGVLGQSEGSYGVYGWSSASDGVHGKSTATDGIGVYGEGGSAGTGVSATGRVGVFATSDQAGWMGVWGRHFGAGYGVAGDSVSHIGVSGVSDATNQPGILARSRGNSTGVLGFSGGTSSTLPAAPAKTGVFGQASQDSSSRGVWGKATSGQGVRGDASTGAAMYGAASNKAGYAIRGSGRIRFDKVCGVASIPAGSTSVTITPGTDITADSFVLLTPKSNIGTRSLYFTTDATNDRFTIRMSSSRTSATSIGWLLLR